MNDPLCPCPWPGCDQYGDVTRYAGYCHRHKRYAKESDTAEPRKCVDCENWWITVDEDGLCQDCREATEGKGERE